MTEGFDFDSWLEEAHEGLKALREKREDLVTQKDTIETSLGDTDREILALEKMLESHIGAVPNDEPADEVPAKRVTGVKKNAKALASELVIGVEYGESVLVTAIQERVEGAREKSCKSALQTLAKEGIYILGGSRGAWTYSTTIGKTDEEVVQEPSEGAEESEAPAPDESATAQEETQESQEQGTPADVKVNGVAEVVCALEKEMKKRTSFPMAEKNIGWIAADLHVEPKVVRDALRIMADGDWEVAYEGESKVLRRKAEPGSKEELKRTQISDTPLFPDADRPPHA